VVGAPTTDIEAVRLGTRRLLRTVTDLTDEQASAKSLLAGWSRAELLTHLARNADGGSRIAEAAARGEIGTQYPGGADERMADIAAGRGVGAAALRADLRRSCDALMESWMRLPDDAWDRVGQSLTGHRTQRGWVWSRWREVEVHHVDLGLGYSCAEWPVTFVSRGLDDTFAELPSRANSRRLPHDVDVRVETTDHARAWIVRVHDDVATVERDDNATAPVNGTVTGWGCDVLAWLYGRDPSAAGLTGSGDLAGLRLPEWFPYP
jgi:maleylpyruvate isomerase